MHTDFLLVGILYGSQGNPNRAEWRLKLNYYMHIKNSNLKLLNKLK